MVNRTRNFLVERSRLKHYVKKYNVSTEKCKRVIRVGGKTYRGFQDLRISKVLQK